MSRIVSIEGLTDKCDLCGKKVTKNDWILWIPNGQLQHAKCYYFNFESRRIDLGVVQKGRLYRDFMYRQNKEDKA